MIDYLTFIRDVRICRDEAQSPFEYCCLNCSFTFKENVSLNKLTKE